MELNRMSSVKKEYQILMIEQKRRQERNGRLLAKLENIEKKAAFLQAKTDRIRSLKSIYRNQVDKKPTKNINLYSNINNKVITERVPVYVGANTYDFNHYDPLQYSNYRYERVYNEPNPIYTLKPITLDEAIEEISKRFVLVPKEPQKDNFDDGQRYFDKYDNKESFINQRNDYGVKKSQGAAYRRNSKLENVKFNKSGVISEYLSNNEENDYYTDEDGSDEHEKDIAVSEKIKGANKSEGPISNENKVVVDSNSKVNDTHKIKEVKDESRKETLNDSQSFDDRISCTDKTEEITKVSEQFEKISTQLSDSNEYERKYYGEDVHDNIQEYVGNENNVEKLSASGLQDPEQNYQNISGKVEESPEQSEKEKIHEEYKETDYKESHPSEENTHQFVEGEAYSNQTNQPYTENQQIYEPQQTDQEYIAQEDERYLEQNYDQNNQQYFEPAEQQYDQNNQEYDPNELREQTEHQYVEENVQEYANPEQPYVDQNNQEYTEQYNQEYSEQTEQPYVDESGQHYVNQEGQEYTDQQYGEHANIEQNKDPQYENQQYTEISGQEYTDQQYADHGNVEQTNNTENENQVDQQYTDLPVQEYTDDTQLQYVGQPDQQYIEYTGQEPSDGQSYAETNVNPASEVNINYAEGEQQYYDQNQYNTSDGLNNGNEQYYAENQQEYYPQDTEFQNSVDPNSYAQVNADGTFQEENYYQQDATPVDNVISGDVKPLQILESDTDHNASNLDESSKQESDFDFSIAQ